MSIRVFMWAERSRCTWSCVDRSLASELEVLRQRSSGAGLERGPQAPVTKVWDGDWCQAFVRFESRHRHHCMEQDGPSEQQHTEEPMALGGMRSRSSSSGISSRR